MSEKKIIAVLGATGAQGGGLIRAITTNPQSGFVARAVTRDPNSDKAKALAALGAEVVKGDVDDVDSLKKAFAGAYGVFGVTFFWDHFTAQKETDQARNMAEAAKHAGVKHFVWSTLEDTRKFVPLDDNRMPTLQGKYKVPHFDGKGEGDEFFRQIGVPTTFLLVSFYFENFIYFGMGPQKGQDGNLALMVPMGDKKMSGIAAEDIGKCVLSILQRPELIGKTIGLAGDELSFEQYAAEFTKSLNKPISYYPVPFDVFRGLGFPGAEDVGNMFQFYHDFEDYLLKSRSVGFTRELNPKVQSFSDWMKANASRIPLPQ